MSKVRFVITVVVAATMACLVAACTSSTATDPPVRPLAASADSIPWQPEVELDEGRECGAGAELDGSNPLAALELGTELLERVAGEELAGLEHCAVSASPLCAGLYLIAASDPLVWHGASAPDVSVDRAAALYQRALRASALLAVDDEALQLALTELIELDVVSALASGEGSLADLAVARGDQRVVDPIAAAETRC